MREILTGPLTRQDEMLTVSDIWDSSSHWNLSAISFILSPDLLKILQAIPQPLNPTDVDGQFWCFSRNGTFISKSAYRIALNFILKNSPPQEVLDKGKGGPLSPYIFILCMEYLAWLIQVEVDGGHWTGIKASRNGPSFTHLFFVDDLILFAKANKKSCQAIT
jgi:hypothetical protein